MIVGKGSESVVIARNSREMKRKVNFLLLCGINFCACESSTVSVGIVHWEQQEMSSGERVGQSLTVI